MTRISHALLALCLVAPTFANTYFVSTKGTAEGDGSLASPWPTVQYALERVGGGHTIMVRAGFYPGPIFIPKSAAGKATARTVVQSEQKWKAIVIGSSTHGIYTADGTDYVTIDGF